MTAKVKKVETKEFGTWHVRRFRFGDLFQYQKAQAEILASEQPDDEKNHASILALLLYSVCDETGKRRFSELEEVRDLDSELAHGLYGAAIDQLMNRESIDAAKKD